MEEKPSFKNSGLAYAANRTKRKLVTGQDEAATFTSHDRLMDRLAM